MGVTVTGELDLVSSRPSDHLGQPILHLIQREPAIRCLGLQAFRCRIRDQLFADALLQLEQHHLSGQSCPHSYHRRCSVRLSFAGLRSLYVPSGALGPLLTAQSTLICKRQRARSTGKVSNEKSPLPNETRPVA